MSTAGKTFHKSRGKMATMKITTTKFPQDKQQRRKLKELGTIVHRAL